MKTLRIDLHALPGELLSWVEQWLQTEALSAALVWIRPEFEVRTVSDVEAFRREVAARGTPFRVCLKSSAFDIGTTLLTFMDRNPEILWLDVGPGPTRDCAVPGSARARRMRAPRTGSGGPRWHAR